MSDRRQSLATRVLLAVLLILFAGGVLVAGSTWINGRRAARQAYDRVLIGAASDIAESLRVQEGTVVADLPVSAFELLAQAPEDRIFYAVRGPGGVFITGFDTTLDAAGPDGTVGPVYFDGDLQDERARFVRIARRFAERDFSGEVTVTVGQTTRARQAMAIDLMIDALLPMLIAGVALVAMAWFAIRSALRPLDALADDLSHRDPHDLTPMPSERLPGELQVMLEAMNRFMGQLDRQMDAMRNLITDTAHQLRTPVAAVRAQAEAIVDEQDSALRERALTRLLVRTRSLGALLDQLLSRALVIHRTDSAPRVPIDLRDTALNIIERRDHEVLVPGAEVRLVLGEDPVMVLADEFSVEEAVRNLLANAMKHGAPPVEIGAEQRGAEAAIWVRDAGAGPNPDVARRLGERFERSRTSGEGSAGLGLSIVRAVAQAFDGRIETESDATGFRMSLVLPTAPGEGNR